ncbi:MAG: LLM class flavin-dependent oxidoreductase [Acidobacteria bacterium]|nr:LLM class flavin-dependent oxidoreductase [Acidobacteriota bacterium]
MMGELEAMQLEIFSTCPQSSQVEQGRYLQNVIEVAQWSEAAGCTGILVYTDNSLVDAWLVAQVILENTKTLCPLVALQPVYMHPYTAAKMISTYAHLYGRRIYLNLVAGGFKNDLTSLGDQTPHDQRYERLIEYTTIIKQLLSRNSPVTYQGKFYRVDNVKMTPPLPAELFPGILISGSSEAGLAAAKALDATAIKYPKPVSEYEQQPETDGLNSGVRVGVIARADEAEAWEVAHARFPSDRKGQLTHQLAMKVSDSVWHRQLSELGEKPVGEENPYWLIPFQNYKTFCPYLVGSYERVAAEIRRYINVGHQTFILDIPPDQAELTHINQVFQLAQKEITHGQALAAMAH